MRALEKRLGLSGLNYRAEEKVKHFKERVANVKSCVDSNPPRSLVEKEAKGGLSPSKKHVTAKERADMIALDNMLLAKRIFKIMDSPAPISSIINDTRHLQVGHTSMNFRSRLEETQRIHKRNLEFAERLEKVEPVYGYDDLHANRGMLEGRHKSNKKKTKRGKKDGTDDTATDGFLTARSDGATLSPRGVDYAGSPRSAPGGTNKRILYEGTVKKEGEDVYAIVAKDRNSDQYPIFGYSKAGQRYEVRVTSEEISNIIDGDILVTSVERREVWEAFLPKVNLIEVSNFGKFIGLNPEEYLRRKLSLPPAKSPSKPAGGAPSIRGGRAGRAVKKAKTAKELQEEEEQHAAATKLQAMHRAKLARKKVDFHKEMRRAAEEIGDSEEVHGAAAKLQAIHRGKIAKRHVEKKREELDEQHAAAAKLQAIHRGKSAKKEVQKKRDELEQHQAAAKLQAIHRGKIAKRHVEKKREELDEQHAAAAKLQAMHRAKLARKKVDFHKEMRRAAEEIGDSEEVHGAAAKLQAIHRGKSAKKEVQKKRDELEQHQAAAKLQAIHRGKSAKKEVQKRKEELRISQEIGDSPEVHGAATKLQAVQRRKATLKEVEEKRKEAAERQQPRPPSSKRSGSANGARPPSQGRPGSRPSSKKIDSRKGVPQAAATSQNKAKSESTKDKGSKAMISAAPPMRRGASMGF